MGTDDDTFCGCLPWGRRRGTSAGANRRPTSATKVPGTASSAKTRGQLKTAPEPAPAKWRSQVGASDASSTASVQGAISEMGNGAVCISATAFASGDEAAAALAANGARTRSTAAASDIRFSSQPQIGVRPNGSVSSTGNPPGSSYPVSKGSGGGAGSPLPRGDVAFADPDDPASAAATAAAAAVGGEEAVLRLQALQERYRQRVGFSGVDDRFRGDQTALQCDSFTYSVSAQGRRSSFGTGRLGPLPPLPPSPGRVVGLAHKHGGHGHGHAHAVGHVRGVSVLTAQQQQPQQQTQYQQQQQQQQMQHQQHQQQQQQQRDPRKPHDHAGQDKWQKAPPLSTRSPDISRNNSLTTTHIPGSLPSMTQDQVSPGVMRIHPPPAAAAAAWDEAPGASPPPAAAVPLPVMSPWPAQVPRSGAAEPTEARSSNPATAAWGAVAQVRQAEEEQQLLRAAAGGSRGGDEVVDGFSFSPNRGQQVSRLSGPGAGVGGNHLRAGAPQVVRQSNNGGVAHRATHGPAGYSTAAAAAAMPGFALGARQLHKKLSSGGSGLRSDKMTSAAILAMESLAGEGGEYARDSNGSPRSSRTGLEAVGGAGGGGGAGADRPRGGVAPVHGGAGDGRPSLPLYDSFAPGAVLAKPPSFGAGLEHRTSPGCISSGPSPAPMALEAQLQASSGEPQQPQRPAPQRQPSQRLQSAPPRDSPWAADTQSAPVSTLNPRKASADEGPASTSGFGGGPGGGDGGKAQARVEARPSQLRMQAARANEEMLMALLGSSKRALDFSPRGDTPGGGTAAELERFDRVQDAMARLEDILAAPPPPPPPVAPARSINARLGHLEDPTYDFTGATPPQANPALGVKRW